MPRASAMSGAAARSGWEDKIGAVGGLEPLVERGLELAADALDDRDRRAQQARSDLLHDAEEGLLIQGLQRHPVPFDQSAMMMKRREGDRVPAIEEAARQSEVGLHVSARAIGDDGDLHRRGPLGRHGRASTVQQTIQQTISLLCEGSRQMPGRSGGRHGRRCRSHAT